MKQHQQYEPVIGLEIHIQLNTKSKMFCSCSNSIWKEEPNSITCPTCLGLPGALPVPNKEAIKKCQLLGLVLNCSINKVSKFDRKNYFYPDLPKGYQISQYDKPLCSNGYVVVDDSKIRIRRVHLEEDTGKSIHTKDGTLLDYNKSGVPLAEVVTDPDIETAEEAATFARKVRELAISAGVSNGDMEKGNMRFEANVSMRKVSEKSLPNYRVEIKNINSFKFLKNAIEFEIERQREGLLAGRKLVQETRGWNEAERKTFSQRSKEFENDYRYFPEPDIPPMEFGNDYIEDLKKSLALANVDPVIEKVQKGTSSAEPVRKQYTLDDKGELSKVALKVICENPKAVNDYKTGKKEALKFLVGCIMYKTSGEADPKVSLGIIKTLLAK